MASAMGHATKTTKHAESVPESAAHVTSQPPHPATSNYFID
ncbi:hypothetical protein [Persicirhabdus sediminis]|nr:hypothetical protein [Persicirhabdus sediminis]